MSNGVKKFSKVFVTLMLLVAMAVSMSACGNGGEITPTDHGVVPTDNSVVPTDNSEALADHDADISDLGDDEATSEFNCKRQIKMRVAREKTKGYTLIG